MISLAKYLEFTRFYHKFRNVERLVHAVGNDRMENLVEHSTQVAFTAWYIVSSLNLGLNLQKIVLYALVHDLPETYAGDPMFNISPEAKANKKVAEEEARKRIAAELSEFPELIEMLEAYEKREDPESKFIYALDKILAVTNIILDEGRDWKEDGITLAELQRVKDSQVSENELIADLWKQIVKMLKKEGKNLNLPMK